VIVVPAAEQLVRLRHLAPIFVERRRWHGQTGLGLGRDVQPHWHGVLADRILSQPSRGHHRRVDKRIQRHPCEPNDLADASRAVQRRCEQPVLRQLHRGIDADAACVVARRIQHVALPLQVHHQRRAENRANGLARGYEELEVDVDCSRSDRHVDVERSRLRGIAQPFQGLAAGTDDEAGHLVECVGRHGVARDPLREQQRQLLHAAHGHRLVDAMDAAQGVRRVDFKADGAGIVHVARRRNRGRRRGGLGKWPAVGRLVGDGRRGNSKRGRQDDRCLQEVHFRWSKRDGRRRHGSCSARADPPDGPGPQVISTDLCAEDMRMPGAPLAAHAACPLNQGYCVFVEACLASRATAATSI